MTSIPVAPTDLAAPSLGARSRGARLVRHHALALLAGGFIVILIATSALAPWLAPFHPGSFDLANALKPPSLAHPLGTDDLGRDVLMRLMHGTANTLGMAGASVVVACSIGALLGLIAGYFGRWFDVAIMRSADVLLAFPGLLLALTLVTFIGPSVITIVSVLALTHMPRYSRLIRSVVLSLREREFVVAARAVGARPTRVIRRHLLPNAMAPLIVYATLDLGFTVTAVAGLSFLGFGLTPPAQSWGQLLAEGRRFTAQAPWMATFSGLAITLAVLSFNIVGDTLRDLLDPKLRKIG